MVFLVGKEANLWKIRDEHRPSRQDWFFSVLLTPCDLHATIIADAL